MMGLRASRPFVATIKQSVGENRVEFDDVGTEFKKMLLHTVVIAFPDMKRRTSLEEDSH